jgi:hypothetical protein
VLVDDEDLPSRWGIDGADGIEELWDGVGERDKRRKQRRVVLLFLTRVMREDMRASVEPVQVLSLVSSIHLARLSPSQ